MKKRTRSILEEINSIANAKDKEYIIENNAENIIASTTNLIELINETYNTDIARDLVKRLLNSIRTQDPTKFQRGIRTVNETIRRRRPKL